LGDYGVILLLKSTLSEVEKPENRSQFQPKIEDKTGDKTIAAGENFENSYKMKNRGKIRHKRASSKPKKIVKSEQNLSTF
jgi:hypothetical protein